MTINPIHLKEKIAICNDFTTEERDTLLEIANLGNYVGKHTYPSNPQFGPNSKNDFVRHAWAIMDQLSPNAMTVANRFLLSGLFAGAMSEMYRLGKEKKPPTEKSFRWRQ